jgi:hypothetical protein
VARVYDYLLGGKDNFAADREAAEQAIRINPDIVPTARANRAFGVRTTRYLVGQAGIRQFLDIGTGMPTNNNIHEVAQSIAPGSRIVYVDHDPIVLTHARALLSSVPEGVTDYIKADLREPGKILAEAAQTLDFSRPVAIMLIAILHLILDWDDPYDLVSQLGLPFAFAHHFSPANTLPAPALYRSHFRPSEVLDRPTRLRATAPTRRLLSRGGAQQVPGMLSAAPARIPTGTMEHRAGYNRLNGASCRLALSPPVSAAGARGASARRGGRPGSAGPRCGRGCR